MDRNCNQCRFSNEDDLCDEGHIERQPCEADYGLACVDFKPIEYATISTEDRERMREMAKRGW